jgi:predicted transcriptional regulator of viral defense system
MRAVAIRRYLPALLLHVQRRLEGGGGAVASVHIRDVCGVDRRCGIVVHWLMMRLMERGLAKRHKRGTYLIERSVAEEVLTALRQWI